SARKSALLSAAKKQRLKNNPSRVRFAESVDINGSSSYSPSNFNSSESTTPFMPNVLKVFLENGQTKSFKYDSSTTVGDVLDSLHQKLGIKCPEHFSLVVEHVKSLRRNKLTLLDPKETLSRIAARPGAQHLRCLYRVTFVPRDAYDLLRKDSMAFEYLYLQVNNPVNWGISSIPRSHAPAVKSYSFLQSARKGVISPWLTTDLCSDLSLDSFSGSSRLYGASFLHSLASSFGCNGPFGDEYPPLEMLCRLTPGNLLLSSESSLEYDVFPVSSPARTPYVWSSALLNVICASDELGTHLSCPFTTNYSSSLHSLYPVVGRGVGVLYFRKPTWRDIGKWAWNYRRLLQMLYKLRFLLYLLARLKVLGKWALRFKIVALIYKHLEVIMRHLEKLKGPMQAFLQWRMVRKLLSQMRRLLKRYFGWTTLWRLLKRLIRRKK
ncbi:Frmpd3p, partial [Halocaridina rubra]